MNKLITSFFCLTFFISFQPLFADTSTETLKMPNSEGTNSLKVNDLLINKKFEQDLDITDAKIKADSGSLSQYSLKFSLSYYGPGITDLNNPNQPNPDGTVCNCETSVGGSISARYRFDKKSSLGFGSGINANTPVQGVKRWDVKNPFLSYDRTVKISGFQIRNSFTGSYITNNVYKKVGEVAGLGYDNSVVYYLDEATTAVGFDTSLAYYLFNRDYQKSDNKTNRYSISFYPNVKYNFTDNFNVYSSLSLSYWNPRSDQDQSILYHKVLSQRLGFGYAYSRDIYISPYFNFYPKQFKTDSTTVNISTTFSML